MFCRGQKKKWQRKSGGLKRFGVLLVGRGYTLCALGDFLRQILPAHPCPSASIRGWKRIRPLTMNGLSLVVQTPGGQAGGIALSPMRPRRDAAVARRRRWPRFGGAGSGIDGACHFGASNFLRSVRRDGSCPAIRGTSAVWTGWLNDASFEVMRRYDCIRLDTDTLRHVDHGMWRTPWRADKWSDNLKKKLQHRFEGVFMLL